MFSWIKESAKEYDLKSDKSHNSPSSHEPVIYSPVKSKNYVLNQASTLNDRPPSLAISETSESYMYMKGEVNSSFINDSQQGTSYGNKNKSESPESSFNSQNYSNPV